MKPDSISQGKNLWILSDGGADLHILRLENSFVGRVVRAQSFGDSGILVALPCFSGTPSLWSRYGAYPSETSST